MTVQPYFDTEERIASLLYHAAKWHGTPFHRNAGLLGVGVDCVHLAGLILRYAGALPEFRLPARYSMDGGHHQGESAIVAWLDSNRHFARVPETPDIHGRGCVECGGAVGMIPDTHAVMPGDVLVFNVTRRGGGVEWHCGLMLHPPEFIHVLEGRTVEYSSLDDSTYNKRLRAIYRPVTPNSQLPSPIS